MNEIEKLAAEIQALKLVLTAVICETETEFVVAALQRVQEIHAVSALYGTSLSDAQCEHVQRFVSDLIRLLPRP